MDKVLSFRRDGLGSRLMAMTNGIRLAKRFGAPSKFIWSADQALGYIEDPGHLFDTKQCSVNGLQFTNWTNALSCAEPELIYSDGFAAQLVEDRLLSANAALICCSHFQRISTERTEVVRPALAEAARQIVASDMVDEALAQVGWHAESIPASIGLHVRRGDTVNHERKVDRDRALPLSVYFDVIRRIGFERKNIIIVTEDPAVIDEVTAEFPQSNIYFAPATSYDRDSAESYVDAFRDLYLLAGAEIILGGLSAFNRFSAAVGYRPLLTLYPGQEESELNLLRAAQEFMNFQKWDLAEATLRALFPAPSERIRGAFGRFERLTGSKIVL